MKRMGIFLWALCLLCGLFSGCGSQPPASKAAGAEGAEPLRVLVDLDCGSNIVRPKIKQALDKYKMADEKSISFSKAVGELGGPALKLEYPPLLGEERELYLASLRTEIMAGKGPDVFVCMTGPNYVTDPESLKSGVLQGDWEEPVFQFPQQAMKRKLFLDLSGYIPEFQFTDWEALTPVIMDAGRYRDGQYILPMTYTVPVTIFKKAEAPHTCTEDMTWYDMLEGSPALRAAAVMDNSIYQGGVFRPFASLEQDKLAFSEEELLDLVTRKLLVREEVLDNGTVPAFSWNSLGVGIDEALDTEDFDQAEDLSMIPVYSLQGGYGAVVTSFAAVSANTSQPEAAAFLADYLLSEECQSSCLYAYATVYNSLPTMEGLPREGRGCSLDTEGRLWVMPRQLDESFAGLQRHIAWAEFGTPLGVELQQLFCDAQDSAQTKPLDELVHAAYMRMQMMLAES